MSKFAGGSAYAMARDIGEGYVTVTDRTFRLMTPGEMQQLEFEIDRFLRELRGSQSPADELRVVQARNRKIQRLTSATMIARVFRQKTKR
jgi:hypothetical protein